LFPTTKNANASAKDGRASVKDGSQRQTTAYPEISDSLLLSGWCFLGMDAQRQTTAYPKISDSPAPSDERFHGNGRVTAEQSRIRKFPTPARLAIGVFLRMALQLLEITSKFLERNGDSASSP
jgi:hypothetical protein